MQALYSELIGIPVFDEYSKAPLALVQDVIIDPETGKVIAFLVKNKHIVVPLDVLRVSRGIFIPDKSHILPMSEVLRVEEVFQRRIPIAGMRVVTQREKTYLGKVVDYAIDTTHMVLTQIHVAKTFFFFHFQEKIISYVSIIRIEKDRIIVKDARGISVKEKVPARSSAFA